MQALKLLKLVKGVTKIHTPWNPTQNGYYSWLFMINEGGTPLNMTIGIYSKEKREQMGKWFIYIYLFGWKIFKKA